MKINMNHHTAEEIISHLEIYGDNNDGNIIRILIDMKSKLDEAYDDLREFELQINDESEVDRLQYENDELQEKLDKISEILKES